MPVPTDPTVRRLRGVIGSAVRDGNEPLALEARRQIAAILALRSLSEVAPTLTDAERSSFASVLFSGQVSA